MSEMSPPVRSGKRFRLLRIVAVIVLGAAIGLWCFVPPSVRRDIVVLTRTADGTLREADAAHQARAGFNARLGTLKASNSTICSSSSQHSNPAFLATRSVIILNQSDDLLMERVGTELLEVLKQELPVDRIEYYPSGHFPEPGGVAPDLYLVLDLPSKQHSGLLSDTLDATVTAQFSTEFAESSCSVSDGFSPPLVRFKANVEVQHHSTFTGVASSAAAYELQGQDIAKQIAGQITKRLDDDRQKHSPLPELPAVLSDPEFTPVPEFAFLKELHAALVISARGLMVHNETFWRCSTQRTAAELFEAIKPELVEKNWTIYSESVEFPRSAYFRATSGARVLTVFPADQKQLPATPDEPQTGTADYFIEYRDRISREVLASVVDETLAREPINVDLLLAFRSFADRAQNRRVIELLEAQKPGTARGWMLLADHYSAQKDVEACRRALLKLTCLEQLAKDAGEISRKIQEVAKQHKIDKSEYCPPTRADWLELGLRELTVGLTAAPVEFGLNVPIGFFVTGDDGQTDVYSVEFRRSGSSTIEAVHLHSSQRSRSWTTGGAFYSGQTTSRHPVLDGPDGMVVEFVETRLAPDRFRVTAELKTR